MPKFYITTPIYYVNDKPHIGHAYTTIAADAIARWRRMCGDEVFFLVGTDENASKNADAARQRMDDSPSPLPFPSSGGEGVRQIVQQYVDEMSAKWRRTWDTLGITHNDFIRTTETRHIKAVEKFWRAVEEKGDIYLGTYTGLYCDGCEAYKTDSELEDGNCPDHKRAPRKIEEENYFFRASKYRDALLQHIKDNPDFIQPAERRHEVENYIKDHFEDVSISRQNQSWGIPIPETSSTYNLKPKTSHVIYVWFDALINYLTAVGYSNATNNPQPTTNNFLRWWPADLHLVGKDIIKFHCALWPAMLMSAGLPLPKRVFAHGFFTIQSEKISKTVGNVVDPVELAQKYGNDTLRFFLLNEFTFGDDGDFTLRRMEERYEGDLGNELGNLVLRTLAMIEQYFKGAVPADSPSKPALPYLEVWKQYCAHFDAMQFTKAIEVVWHLLREGNQTIDREKPWELAKTDATKLGRVLHGILLSLYHVAWMLAPVMPETSEKILAQLGFDPAVEKKKPLADIQGTQELPAGQKIKKGGPMFPRLNDKSAI